MGWKVFYESLNFYQKRSPEAVRNVLAREFGLVGPQTAQLFSAGQSFLADLKDIDTYAKTEAARRYKYVPVQSGPPPKDSSRRYPPHKSIRDRAIEDGLYADVHGE
jgi:hypothetical protein